MSITKRYRSRNRNSGGQRTEDRGQRTEDRGQRTEDRGQRTEDRGYEQGSFLYPFDTTIDIIRKQMYVKEEVPYTEYRSSLYGNG